MGAIAPVPDFTVAIRKDFETAILTPTLKGIAAEKMDYRGFLTFNLMVKDGSCFLLEYKVHLGDPETQAVFSLLGSDLAELCNAILDGTLADFPIKWRRGAVCTPVVAADGYPGAGRVNDPIAINPTGFGRIGAKLFVAGAGRGPGGHLGSGLRTQGGRALAVSALGENAFEARTKAYEALRFIGFEDMVLRRDIGLDKEEAVKANG
jgi:phosphoribosylamine-glycine ligase